MKSMKENKKVVEEENFCYFVYEVLYFHKKVVKEVIEEKIVV